MKILIVSDSHGNNEVLDELVRTHTDVSLFLHCGDSCCPAHSIFPFKSVRGNCDYLYDMEETFILPSPFGNILLKHKPNATDKFLKDNNIRIYVYGHSHIKECSKKNNICYINPGSVSEPRDGDMPSYIILENDEKEMFCSFYEVDSNKLIKKFRVYVKE
mgnify:CR=1 FL=1